MNKYVFKPYNPIFPTLFEKEKTKLKNLLGNTVIIEHIGSTAIPNTGGKGIIDIMVGIGNKQTSFKDILVKLERTGDKHREQADAPERIFFRVDRLDEFETIRRYHVHVTYHNSNDWNETLNFRDYLRANPYIVKEYETLKINVLKKNGNDGKLYRKLKEPFIKKYSK